MDFIKVEYTGYDNNGRIFDSTSGEVAKTLHKKEGPLLVILKIDALPKGLEEALLQMRKGEEKELVLTPEKAFGYPNKKLVKVFSTSYFQSQNVKPVPGLTVYLDTDKGRVYGTIKSVNSGRVVVDLNHPLAGKTVRYNVKLVDILTKDEEKIKALLDRYGIKGEATLKDTALSIEIQKNPENLAVYEKNKVALASTIKHLFKNIKSIDVKEV